MYHPQTGRPRRAVLSVLLAPLLLGYHTAAAATTVTFHPDDPSPHRSGRVQVAPGVRVEYLDWGGSGEPLVLIAGLGNTAHIFDDLAPRLTERHRVIGVTRRGFGGSDRAVDGYDTATLAADLGAVLDDLGLGRVTLVAHSVGGVEAQAFARARPEQVRGVIFLDSADFGCNSPPELPTHLPSGRKLAGLFINDPYNRPLPAADRVSALAERVGYQRRLGWSPPPGELLAQRGEQPQGRRAAEPEGGVFGAIRRGQQRCLPGLEIPVLLITVSEPQTEWVALDEQDRQIELTPEDQRFLQEDWAEHRRSIAARFQEQMPAGRVAAVPKAHHMVFLSHPEETLHAMREFLGAAR